MPSAPPNGFTTDPHMGPGYFPPGAPQSSIATLGPPVAVNVANVYDTLENQGATVAGTPGLFATAPNVSAFVSTLYAASTAGQMAPGAQFDQNVQIPGSVPPYGEVQSGPVVDYNFQLGMSSTQIFLQNKMRVNGGI